MIKRPEPPNPFDVEPEFRGAIAALLSVLRSAKKSGQASAGVLVSLTDGVPTGVTYIQWAEMPASALAAFKPEEPE